MITTGFHFHFKDLSSVFFRSTVYDYLIVNKDQISNFCYFHILTPFFVFSVLSIFLNNFMLLFILLFMINLNIIFLSHFFIKCSCAFPCQKKGQIIFEPIIFTNRLHLGVAIYCSSDLITEMLFARL